MKPIASYLLAVCLLAFGLSATPKAEASEWIKELRSLPVQDSGRVKPFDTFATETLKLVYGRSKFKGRLASEVVLTWILAGDQWVDAEIIEIGHSGLKEALNYPMEKKHYSTEELMQNVKLPLVFQELQNRRNRQEKLNPYFQAVQRLESQLGLLQLIKQGKAPGVAPDPNSDAWIPPGSLPENVMNPFTDMAKAYVAYVAAFQSQTSSNLDELDKEVKAKILAFKEAAKSNAPSKYADNTAIKVEFHYNQFHPFQWAWISYLIGVIFFVSFFVSKSPWQSKAGWIFLTIGFFLHTYGMGVRSYLSGRPPVTNMYETVVWVPWGALVFGWILERVQKNKILLICSATVAVFCLILTDLAPAVLDPSIQPLEPVLRSTFWLTTHVLIITISYAAFFLAFALGDLLLVYFLIDENRFQKQIQQGVLSIYRCMQIGVVLLAAGTILGGVWADYSWGRFWGWDPKETWALIALLGYLAILHGRLTGWIRGFGMVVSSVLSFSLVIMAWYGVNFVLGAGLHSYGFGAGGVEYVTGFVVLHILFVVYVSTVRYGRLKSK